MSPGSRSVVSTNSVTESFLSGESKTLKQFDKDGGFGERMTTNFGNIDPENCDFFILTIPQEFPVKHLNDIPLHSDKPASVKNCEKSYICENTSDKSQTIKSVLIPADESSDSSFVCKSIKNTLCVRKVISTQKPDEKNFLPRPPSPTITEGLVERVKPFGWQKPGEKPESDIRSLVTVSPSKRRKTKKSARKVIPIRKPDAENFLPTPLSPSITEGLVGKVEPGEIPENDIEALVQTSPPKRGKTKKKAKKRKSEKKEVNALSENLENMLKNGHKEASSSFVAEKFKKPPSLSSKKSKKHKIPKRALKHEEELSINNSINPEPSRKKVKKEIHSDNLHEYSVLETLHQTSENETTFLNGSKHENGHIKEKKSPKKVKEEIHSDNLYEYSVFETLHQTQSTGTPENGSTFLNGSEHENGHIKKEKKKKKHKKEKKLNKKKRDEKKIKREILGVAQHTPMCTT